MWTESKSLKERFLDSRIEIGNAQWRMDYAVLHLMGFVKQLEMVLEKSQGMAAKDSARAIEKNLADFMTSFTGYPQGNPNYDYVKLDEDLTQLDALFSRQKEKSLKAASLLERRLESNDVTHHAMSVLKTDATWCDYNKVFVLTIQKRLREHFCEQGHMR